MSLKIFKGIILYIKCESLVPGMSEKILVVDDETEITDLLEIYLKNDGYDVLKCSCARDALRMVELVTVDLAILDVMLPDMNGFQLCQKIREKNTFPIIMLTAKNEDSDIVMGLTLGADDYITKPFRPAEVTARVKSQLRRCKKYDCPEGSAAGQEEISIRGLTICPKLHSVTLYREEISLTPIEFSILYYLCTRQGNVVSSEELYDAVWGTEFIDGNNTIMTHIGRLREKLKENARKPKFIKTVWGIGYTID